MKPISLQLYTVRTLMNDANHFDILSEVAAIGYKGVETNTPAGMDPADYRMRVGDLGLAISSTWGSIETDEVAKRSAQTALEMGTDLLVTGYGTKEFGAVDEIQAIAEKVQTMAQLLEKEGVTLCIHNHWWEFVVVDGRIAHERFAELCPAASFEIDIYWAANFGAVDPAEQISKHRNRTPLLHVKDGPLVRGEPMVAVGSGKIDTVKAVAAADEDVLRWLVVELDECGTDMMEAVRQSHKYLMDSGLGE